MGCAANGGLEEGLEGEGAKDGGGRAITPPPLYFTSSPLYRHIRPSGCCKPRPPPPV
jgi:hypothetical protein